MQIAFVSHITSETDKEMPGYDRNRFVGISEDDKQDLTCSICHEVFREPVIAECCLQTYCSDCINEWLTHNRTCPFDRLPLTRSGLKRPARAFQSILNRLKLSCQYEGCEELVRLDQLDKHSEECQFNKLICDKCQCLSPIKHNCLDELLNCNKQIKLELEQMVAEYQSMKVANENLASEIAKIKSTNIPSGSDDGKQLIDRLKNIKSYRFTIIGKSNNFPQDMALKLIQIIKTCIAKITDELATFCEEVAHCCDVEFGASWHCFVYEADSCQHYQHAQMHVKLSIDNIIFNLSKTNWLFYNIIREKKLNSQIGEFRIYKTNLRSFEDAEFIKTLTLTSIGENLDLKKMLKDLADEISRALGGKWQCIGTVCAIVPFVDFANRYIVYGIDNLTIVLFDTKSE